MVLKCRKSVSIPDNGHPIALALSQFGKLEQFLMRRELAHNYDRAFKVIL
jgi:hypothetical protein